MWRALKSAPRNPFSQGIEKEAGVYTIGNDFFVRTEEDGG